MSLIKPTVEKLLESMNALEIAGEYCRNCFEVFPRAPKCGFCETARCKGCKPIHRRIERYVVTYVVLELGLTSSIIESFLHSYHVEVEECAGCFIRSCSGCTGIFFFPKMNVWFCLRCVYKCEMCRKKVVRLGGFKGINGVTEKGRILCKKCRK